MLVNMLIILIDIENNQDKIGDIFEILIGISKNFHKPSRKNKAKVFFSCLFMVDDNKNKLIYKYSSQNINKVLELLELKASNFLESLQSCLPFDKDLNYYELGLYDYCACELN